MKKLFIFLTTFVLVFANGVKIDSGINLDTNYYLNKKTGAQWMPILKSNLLIGYDDLDNTGIYAEAVIKSQPYDGMYGSFNLLGSLSFKYLTPFEIAKGLKIGGQIDYTPIDITYDTRSQVTFFTTHKTAFSFLMNYKKEAIDNKSKISLEITPYFNTTGSNVNPDNVKTKFALNLDNKFGYKINDENKINLNVNFKYDNKYSYIAYIDNKSDNNFIDIYTVLGLNYEYKKDNLKYTPSLKLETANVLVNVMKPDNVRTVNLFATILNLVDIEYNYKKLKLNVKDNFTTNITYLETNQNSTRKAAKYFERKQYSFFYHLDTNLNYSINPLDKITLTPGLKTNSKFEYGMVKFKYSDDLKKYNYTYNMSGYASNLKLKDENLDNYPFVKYNLLSQHSINPYVELKITPVEKLDLILNLGFESVMQFNLAKNYVKESSKNTIKRETYKDNGIDRTYQVYNGVTPEFKVIMVQPKLGLQIKYNITD